MADRIPPISSARPDTSVGMAGTPFAPPVSEISTAIAAGFSSVIHDMRAMHAEMVNMSRTIAQNADISARRYSTASAIPDGQGGLSSPSGMSQEGAAYSAGRARAVATVAGSLPIAPPVDNVSRDANAFSDAYARASSGGVLQDARAGLANRIAERAQNWAGPQPIQDPRDPNVFYRFDPNVSWNEAAGRWQNRVTKQFVSQSSMDATRIVQTPGFKQLPNGSWQNIATGKFASISEVKAAATGLDEMARIASRQRTAGAISSATNAFASGQPLGKSLLAALPAESAATVGRVAGTAAAVYGMYRQGAAKSQELYAKGQAISQYTGGSAFEGYKESLRDDFRSYLAGFNLFGPGAGDMRALLGQANQLGMRGQRKDEFVSYGMDMMGDLKMGSQEVTRIMSAVILAGDSLGGLSQNLQQLNVAAREAGRSTLQARDDFLKVYNSYQTGVLAGSEGAKGIASSLVSESLGLGEGSAQIGLSATTASIQAVAGRSGSTYAEIATGLRGTGTAQANAVSQFYASAKQLLDNHTGTSGISFGQFARQWLRDWSENHKRDADYDENNPFGKVFTEQVFRNQAIDAALNAGFRIEIITRIMQSAGFTTDQPNDATMFVVAINVYSDEIAGELGATSSTATAGSTLGQSAAAQQQRIAPTETSASGGIETFGNYNEAGGRALDYAIAQYANYGTGNFDPLVNYLGSQGIVPEGTNREDVVSALQSGTGSRSFIFEQLMTDVGLSSGELKGNLDDRMVDYGEEGFAGLKVEVGGQEYTIGEAAMNSDVIAAIQRGEGTIKTGDQASRTISELYGMPEGGYPNASGSTVQIRLTPWAERFFEIDSSLVTTNSPVSWDGNANTTAGANTR